jgi:hypothetical protein
LFFFFFVLCWVISFIWFGSQNLVDLSNFLVVFLIFFNWFFFSNSLFYVRFIWSWTLTFFLFFVGLSRSHYLAYISGMTHVSFFFSFDCLKSLLSVFYFGNCFLIQVLIILFGLNSFIYYCYLYFYYLIKL